jgi:hypothetical protein
LALRRIANWRIPERRSGPTQNTASKDAQVAGDVPGWWRDHDAPGAAEIAVWLDGERVYTDRHRDVFTAALA